MESFKKAVTHFVEQLPTKVSVYVVFIVIFSYHVILDKDLSCTCKEQKQRDCWVYMTLPGFLTLILMLWVDQSFQRVLKSTCTRWKSNFVCILFCHIVKAFFIGVLWPVSVLMDGDWYVCCCSTQQLDLACKNKTAITPEEQAAITELKNYSQVIGLSTLISITFVAAIMSPLQWSQCCCTLKQCCTSEQCCKLEQCRTSEWCCMSEHSQKTAFYDEIILEEGKNLTIEELRNDARNKLTAKLKECVDNKELEKCFDVAENLIRSKPLTSNQGDEASPSDPPNEVLVFDLE